MPCRVDDDYSSNDSYYKDQINQLTRLLCGLCGRIEDLDEGYLITADGDLYLWWEAHKQADKVRIKKENEERNRRQKVKNALAKLSPEERKLFGH